MSNLFSKIKLKISELSYREERKFVQNIDENEDSSRYLHPKYKVYFSEKVAKIYTPIIFLHECTSGEPEGVYYRIIGNPNTNEFCIQYYYYWLEQKCLFASHNYDYEPIFIYVKKDDPKPYRIVNGGLGSPECLFHKNEIRPKLGKKDEIYKTFDDVSLSPQPFYPYGENGNVKCKGCFKTYPLNGDDLTFDKLRPKFGIRACSNVFSGAWYDLQRQVFDPDIKKLKKLTDDVLHAWYYEHNTSPNDMPFGHDISDPFEMPYIKFHNAKGKQPKP